MHGQNPQILLESVYSNLRSKMKFTISPSILKRFKKNTGICTFNVEKSYS